MEGQAGTTVTVDTTSHEKPKSTSFHGTVEVPAATAKMRLVDIADEIVAVLDSDPNASVKVVVEISAEFPQGASETSSERFPRTHATWD